MDIVDIRDLDSMERAAFLEAILESGGDTVARDLLTKIVQSQTEFLNWAKGTASGTYPLTMPDGTVINIPSPKKLVEDLAAEVGDIAAEVDQLDEEDFTAIFEKNLV